MKKTALILSVLLILSLFSACGKGESGTETTTEVTETEVQDVVINVNKEIVADETSFLTFVSEFEGLTSTVDDNFYTLTMPQETYKKLLEAKAREVYDAYDALIAQGSFIKDVEYGADFRTVTVSVDREGFDALDSGTKQLQLITVGAYAMSYQMFLTEGQSTLVIAEYADSNEEAMRLSLPIKM